MLFWARRWSKIFERRGCIKVIGERIVERRAAPCQVAKPDPGRGVPGEDPRKSREVPAVNRMEGCIIRRSDCLWIYSAVATAAVAEARYPEAALARWGGPATSPAVEQRVLPARAAEPATGCSWQEPRLLALPPRRSRVFLLWPMLTPRWPATSWPREPSVTSSASTLENSFGQVYARNDRYTVDFYGFMGIFTTHHIFIRAFLSN